MCGIAGLVTARGDADPAAVAAMQRGMVHRGPDGEGRYANADVVLAMRRLSIIDLHGGWQPLYNEDASIALVANGEIYNYVELRAALEQRGHRFRTGSDCECIVHLYEEYGDDCVDHLRGMFAFALWDARARRLLLARDRMGEKPLYLAERVGRLLFASEMKALLASGLVPFELDPAAIHQYFHYQYVPEPGTAVAGVRKLPAGHRLAVEVDGWRLTESRYWSMDDAPPLSGDPAELLRAQLDEVARIVIRSDVPVGVALSGGLDSGAIALLAARYYPGTLEAFSVGYPGRPPSDERRDAEALAALLGIPYHDVELRTDDLVAEFDGLVHDTDDPIADIAGYGYRQVMRLAREHGVPVMLQGQGGDELFWGYDWVRRARLLSAQKGTTAGWAARLPDALALAGVLGGELLRGRSGGRQRLARYRRYLAGPARRPAFYDLSPDWALAEAGLPALYADACARRIAADPRARPDAPFAVAPPWSPAGPLVTRLICSTYLLENGIAQGDRLSMAASVELRLPLVDYRLVETVIGLRKVHDDGRQPAKHWLKLALGDLVPAGLLDRPKRGFTPPVLEWHRALFAAHGQRLREGCLVRGGILAPAAAATLARGDYPPGAIAPLSFKALVLESWCATMQGIAARAARPAAGAVQAMEVTS